MTTFLCTCVGTGICSRKYVQCSIYVIIGNYVGLQHVIMPPNVMLIERSPLYVRTRVTYLSNNSSGNKLLEIESSSNLLLQLLLPNNNIRVTKFRSPSVKYHYFL